MEGSNEVRVSNVVTLPAEASTPLERGAPTAPLVRGRLRPPKPYRPAVKPLSQPKPALGSRAKLAEENLTQRTQSTQSMEDGNEVRAANVVTLCGGSLQKS